MLEHFTKNHDFLVAIDSDGCALDTMEIKHKECFIPCLIKCWDLQPVSRFARAASEFVFLYSRQRGINRFPGLVAVFDLLREWPGVERRAVNIPYPEPLRRWVRSETRLTDSTLRQAAGADAFLLRTLAWSEAVNASVAEMVRGVPPFPLVRESLEDVSTWADILVCSVAPCATLEREWNEHGIARFAGAIAGQEMGSKEEQIAQANRGRYGAGRVLMIGDAPGDLRAARASGALFFPINPGGEDASWELFFKEAAGRFRAGAYDAGYEAALIRRFEALLPEVPKWKEKVSFADVH